jgi:hypothetical protein
MLHTASRSAATLVFAAALLAACGGSQSPADSPEAGAVPESADTTPAPPVSDSPGDGEHIMPDGTKMGGEHHGEHTMPDGSKMEGEHHPSPE